jgi:hypothetical protein
MMNISRFHTSCIQKKDNRSYFTVGGAIDHFEHFKRTEQYVHTICFSRIGVCGLPVNEGRQRACAKSPPQRCGGNIRKRFLLFEYASYAHFPLKQEPCFYRDGIFMVVPDWIKFFIVLGNCVENNDSSLN